jgi:hypothetical protein
MERFRTALEKVAVEIVLTWLALHSVYTLLHAIWQAMSKDKGWRRGFCAARPPPLDRCM